MSHVVFTSWTVSTSEIRQAARAHAEAVAVFPAGTVSALHPHAVNGGATFFVGPSGSKAGWPEVEPHDDACGAFRRWLFSQQHSDGSSPYHAVCVEICDDWEDGTDDRVRVLYPPGISCRNEPKSS